MAGAESKPTEWSLVGERALKDVGLEWWLGPGSTALHGSFEGLGSLRSSGQPLKGRSGGET